MATTYLNGREQVDQDLVRHCRSCSSNWLAATPEGGDEDGPARETCAECVEEGFGPNPEARHLRPGRRIRYRRRLGAWFEGTIEAFPSTDPGDGPTTILVRTADGGAHHVNTAEQGTRWELHS